MARAQITDPFHNFRFHVTATKSGTIDPFGATTAGFNSVATPSASLEVVEYKEGIHRFKRKFLGDATFDDVTLTRGVTVTGSEFYNWMYAAMKGNEYRTDIVIKHFHRDNIKEQTAYETLTPSRTISLFECVPVTVKPGSDLDSTASDISIQEITVAYEYFEISNLLV